MLEGLFREKAKGNLSLSGGDRKSDNAKSGCQISDKAVDTRQELTKIAGALLGAEVRIGQLFKAMPKAEAGRPSKISTTGGTNKTTINLFNRSMKNVQSFATI